MRSIIKHPTYRSLTENSAGNSARSRRTSRRRVMPTQSTRCIRRRSRARWARPRRESGRVLLGYCRYINICICKIDRLDQWILIVQRAPITGCGKSRADRHLFRLTLSLNLVSTHSHYPVMSTNGAKMDVDATSEHKSCVPTAYTLSLLKLTAKLQDSESVNGYSPHQKIFSSFAFA